MTSLLARLPESRAMLKEDVFFPIEQQFNQFFNEFFKGSSLLDGVKATSGYPRMDVSVNSDNLTIKVAVPGMKAEDIQVEVLPDGTLKLSGQMAEEYRSPPDSKVYVSELRKSKFSRHITLPDWVEGEPEASLKDGILVLKWKTKNKPKELPKLVQVKTE